MIPWFWFWAPQLHLPWSGDVAQRIEPVTHWFFQGIAPGAGHPRIEEKAFDVATYGRQLGLIAEVLLGSAAPEGSPQRQQAGRALEELGRIAAEIEEIKQREYRREAADLAATVRAAKRQGGPAYERLAAALRAALDEPAGPAGTLPG